VIRAGADKPGVTNLLEILAAARGMTIPAAEAMLADARGYGDLKAEAANAVVELLDPVRERYVALRADERRLEEILEMGAAKARAMTEPVMADVRAVMGVGPA
jgi:tryptophanyl-tRNA synthetase